MTLDFTKNWLLPALLGLISLLTGCRTMIPFLNPEKVPTSRNSGYRLTLMAYNSGTEVGKGRSVAGHASISLDRNGVWGFYPETEGRILTLNGRLEFSSEYPVTQEFVEFIVDKETRDEIGRFINRWSSDPPWFSVPFNDCVGFMYKICDIAGIRYNPLVLLPVRAIRTIRKMNDPLIF